MELGITLEGITCSQPPFVFIPVNLIPLHLFAMMLHQPNMYQDPWNHEFKYILS